LTNKISRLIAQTCLVALLLPLETAVFAAKNSESPLSDDVQSQIEKASRYAKSGKADRAFPLLQAALNSANDIPKCLAVATATEPFGAKLVDIRRGCLSKALSLCTTREDYLQVALKARQYESYDVTRQAINTLIGNATSTQDLLDLAKKAQEVALNDVAHLAMEKAYSLARTVPEGLAFCREAKLLGMDDLLRKAMKDLIDDESNAHQLMVLLKNFEPYEMKDLDRYLMKKALDQSSTFNDYYEIWMAARRHRENDIQEVALFRGRKKKLLNQIDAEKEAQRKQFEEQAQKAQDELGQGQAGIIPGGNGVSGGTPKNPSGF